MRSFFLLIIIFFASSYALFTSGLFHVHDYTHAARIAEMTRGLDAGQLPVRWSDNFGYGFGMPLFNFYAPLPYFIGALFHKLGFSIIMSVKLLYLTIAAITIVGAFLLGKRLYGRFAGVLLAALYTLAPYRALNLFVRGALSEAMAMAFFPWVLWSILSYIKQKEPKYLLYTCLSLTGIILSHNLSALMFFPMAALFALLLAWHYGRLSTLWSIAAYFLLSIGLAGFYVLPAFMEKNETIIERIFAGYFHYSHHFLYIRQFFNATWGYGGSAWGPNDDISFFFGFAAWGGLLCAAILLLLNIWQTRKHLLENRVLIISVGAGFLFLFSLFFTLLKSQFIWDQVSILSYIQFPWRFLAPASFWLAIIVVGGIYLIKSGRYRWILATLLFSLSLYNLSYFKPKEYLENPDALYYSDATRIQTEMSSVLPDYIPKQMAAETTLLELGQTLPVAWLDNQSEQAEQNSDSVTVMIDHGFEKLVSVASAKESILNFKVAYFPGWRAEINGIKTTPVYDQELGNLQVKVPAGQSQVGIYFGEHTPARIWGDLLSILSLFCLLYFHFGTTSTIKVKQVSKD